MLLRRQIGSARRRIITRLGRRELQLFEARLMVSFTFDDFPLSALHTGGAILKCHGFRGTYYAATGLLGTANHLGQHFAASDLETLLNDGHELGSHTFAHASCRALALPEFEAEVIKGKQVIERIAGAGKPHHFAYPYGEVTLRAKRRIGAHCASCRGIFPGINTSPVDLNLLRANSLYSSTFSADAVSRLLELTERLRGWLIFYTHDVAERPSRYGCTPAQLEHVVKLVERAGAAVFTVGEAVARASGQVEQAATEAGSAGQDSVIARSA
jgi:peptidoglycan/xylan/chitin deacetylase (PgdA/CDA1 family)